MALHFRLPTFFDRTRRWASCFNQFHHHQHHYNHHQHRARGCSRTASVQSQNEKSFQNSKLNVFDFDLQFERTAK
jgi:hypothetical protein